MLHERCWPPARRKVTKTPQYQTLNRPHLGIGLRQSLVRGLRSMIGEALSVNRFGSGWEDKVPECPRVECPWDMIQQSDHFV